MNAILIQTRIIPSNIATIVIAIFYITLRDKNRCYNNPGSSNNNQHLASIVIVIVLFFSTTLSSINSYAKLFSTNTKKNLPPVQKNL